VERVLGRTAGDHGVHMSGKTDPQIALEILANLAISGDEARSHLPDVLRALERELVEAEEVIRATGRELPGARAALQRLAATPGVTQTVLSGNLEANARLKLAAFGLDRFVDWDIGAYGSDDEDRTRLIPIALRRAREVHGLRFEPPHTWVVGDTPRDLECARAGGTRCLLVGTGRYAAERLRDLGADAVLPDLADTDGVVGILLR
jgi:phosphoglycolate phosphatase-like HAD superfamily hydrolase